jgi:hypothetical protein
LTDFTSLATWGCNMKMQLHHQIFSLLMGAARFAAQCSAAIPGLRVSRLPSGRSRSPSFRPRAHSVDRDWRDHCVHPRPSVPPNAVSIDSIGSLARLRRLNRLV